MSLFTNSEKVLCHISRKELEKKEQDPMVVLAKALQREQDKSQQTKEPVLSSENSTL